ncbi:hypothetical protein BGY98DRAFT_1095506 [Russula aff. rugulosa BPL654]|nr:hypothetical protein BGY98DRAFT_1095506 [Russula aff. rugulosa BPL654]
MSEDFMLMEMPGAFERGQYGDYGVARPDVVRAGNAQDNGRQRSIPLGVVLTGYRLLTTIVIVGIGIPKAVYSYYGQSLVSPSLDWVGGIMFALLLGFISEVGLTNFVKLMVFRFFWLGVIEATRPELCPSFFQDDLAPAILGFLGRDDTPSFLDPATLGSLRRSNTPPLAPPTLGSSSLRRRGDTSSPLVPETLGVLSDDTSIPLIPGIPGVPNRDDTSPLDPATVGSLQRDNTLSLHL